MHDITEFNQIVNSNRNHNHNSYTCRKSKDDFRYIPQQINRYIVRGGNLRVASNQLRIVTWNVESLTDIKIEILQRIMKSRGIDILCLQETHRVLSDVIVTDD